ncbi:toll/interleukin-1 receptor domain-containing protein [Sorangium cellulosum]|uniref:toll/interleukin-1 receptor domain-containing protein n=1 Tax=Sorangium cellulosum TaxID=56 RepID=UPI0011DD4555
MGESVDVFISYATADREFCEQAIAHLARLQRQGVIRTWYDKMIIPGEIRDSVIAARLEGAHVILLLISASFLASDDCYRFEMERALARHARGKACVIPIIIRACDWMSAPFAHLTPLPRGAQAVMSWRNVDEAWTSVVSGIRAAVTELSKIDKKPEAHIHDERQPYCNTDTTNTLPNLSASSKNAFLGRATSLVGVCVAGAATTVFWFHTHQSEPILVPGADSNTASPTETGIDGGTVSATGGSELRGGAKDTDNADAGAQQPESANMPLAGFISFEDSDLPVQRAHVTLAGTPCQTKTDEGRYFNFSSCDPKYVRRINHPAIYIKLSKGYQCGRIKLLPPPAVSGIQIRKKSADKICTIPRGAIQTKVRW